MFFPMTSASPLRRRRVSPAYGPDYGLLDALDQPQLVPIAEVSQSSAPAGATKDASISPLRWLARQVGLLDLLGGPDWTEQAHVPISAREPTDPTGVDILLSQARQALQLSPKPEFVRDENRDVWRKDVYDLIEDVAVATPQDEPALRQRIQDVLADSPHTRDFWFHYELSNRLAGDDPETIRKSLRSEADEMSVQARETIPQVAAAIALAGKPILSHAGRRSTLIPTAPSTSKQSLAETETAPSFEGSASSTNATAASPAVARGQGNRTRLGIVRTSRADWLKLKDDWDALGYGDILSVANRNRIDAGYAPIVDETWVKYFSEDAGLIGERIDMHHIGSSVIRVPWPFTRHRDALFPGGARWNPGGPGSAAPFYPRREPND